MRMKRIGGFIGLLWMATLGLWGQADIHSYKLEVKLAAETQRIAGTCLIKLQPRKHMDRWEVLMSDSLRVVRAYLNGESVAFRQENGAVQFIFRPAIRRGQTHEIALIYGGAPGHTPAQQNAVWQLAEDGSPLIRMDAETLPPESWFPVPAGIDQALDSVRFAVIFDRDYSPLAPGRLIQSHRLPGAFRRWEFGMPQGITPADLYLYLGRFRSRKEIFARESGFGEIEFVLSPTATQSDPAALKQIAQAARVYETYFGPLSGNAGGLQWMQVEPWSLTEPGMEVYGMPAHWPRRLAGYWWGQAVRPDDEAAADMLDGLCVYAEGVLLGTWQDFEAEREWALDTAREDFDPASACWFTLRTLTDNDYVWWDALRGFHEQYAGQAISRDDLISYFNWKLDMECDPIFAQYLDAKQPPILEFKRERKGKRLMCAFRWSSPVPGFQMTVPWSIDGETEYLTVTDDWLRFERKGLKPNDVNPEVSRLWITLRQLK
ncbi:MAG: hypothetical protein AAFV07_00915 [Bacteroidota bacterium]